MASTSTPSVASDLAKFAPRALRSATKKGWLTDNSDNSASKLYCLFGNLLYCFTAEDAASFNSIIFLESSTVKKLTTNAASSSGAQYGISITTVGGRNFNLSVRDSQERQDWIDAIEEGKLVNTLRRVEDHEAETLQLRHRAEQLEHDMDGATATTQALTAQVAELLEKQQEMARCIVDLEGKLDHESSRVRIVESERKLLLRAKGIIPRTLPSWARHLTAAGAGAGTGTATAPGGISGSDSSTPTGRNSITRGRSLSNASNFTSPPVVTKDVAKVWVGSWNVGAMEPFAGMDLHTSFRALRPFVPSGYDIYFVGIQEGVKDGLFERMESLLAIEGCRRIRLDVVQGGYSAGNGEYASHSVDSEGGGGGGGGFGGDCRPNGVGHGNGSNSYPSSSSGGGPSHSTDSNADPSKLLGRGDGSLLSCKFAGIALYVHQKYLADLKVHAVKQLQVSQLTSKGAVAVVLSILGRTIVFITCHLESRNNDLRRQQFSEITAQLGSMLGEAGYHLNEQFHHIFWCGDFNYKLLDISGQPLPTDIVVKMLKDHLNMTLYDTHDQLNQEKRAQQAFFGYREANPFPNFYPTYKKIENRPPLNYNSEDGQWVHQCYRLKFREPFYKGGKTKERTPAFCDRVLYHSLADLATDLTPEPVQVDLSILQHGAVAAGAGAGVMVHSRSGGKSKQTGSGSVAARVLIDNYQAVNEGEGMSLSDHSPVFGTFLLQLVHNHADNVIVLNEDVSGTGSGSSTTTTTTDIASLSLDDGRSSSSSNTGASASKLLYVERVAGKRSAVNRSNSLMEHGNSSLAGPPIPPPNKATPTKQQLKQAANASASATASPSTSASASASAPNRSLMKEFTAADKANNADALPQPPPSQQQASIVDPPRHCMAFCSDSLLPPGPYTIRISNIKVIWGAMDDIPSAVSVLFPLPYEAVAGEAFVDFLSESLVDVSSNYLLSSSMRHSKVTSTTTTTATATGTAALGSIGEDASVSAAQGSNAGASDYVNTLSSVLHGGVGQQQQQQSQLPVPRYVTADCVWRREFAQSRTGTCMPLHIDLPTAGGAAAGGAGDKKTQRSMGGSKKSPVKSSSPVKVPDSNFAGGPGTSTGCKVVPSLQLVWRGDEPLDKLHIGLKVKVPAYRSGSGSDARIDGDPADFVEGHCAIGLEKLCKLALCSLAATTTTTTSTQLHGATGADAAGSGSTEAHSTTTTTTTTFATPTGNTNVNVKMSVAQLLLSHGVPMHLIDANTLQREMATLCCNVELLIQNDVW